MTPGGEDAVEGVQRTPSGEDPAHGERGRALTPEEVTGVLVGLSHELEQIRSMLPPPRTQISDGPPTRPACPSGHFGAWSTSPAPTPPDGLPASIQAYLSTPNRTPMSQWTTPAPPSHPALSIQKADVDKVTAREEDWLAFLLSELNKRAPMEIAILIEARSMYAQAREDVGGQDARKIFEAYRGTMTSPILRDLIDQIKRERTAKPDKTKAPSSSRSDWTATATCFRCHEVGHIAPQCPGLNPTPKPNTTFISKSFPNGLPAPQAGGEQ